MENLVNYVRNQIDGIISSNDTSRDKLKSILIDIDTLQEQIDEIKINISNALDYMNNEESVNITDALKNAYNATFIKCPF